jgi:hypothetical protein
MPGAPHLPGFGRCGSRAKLRRATFVSAHGFTRAEKLVLYQGTTSLACPERGVAKTPSRMGAVKAQRRNGALAPAGLSQSGQKANELQQRLFAKLQLGRAGCPTSARFWQMWESREARPFYQPQMSS